TTGGTTTGGTTTGGTTTGGTTGGPSPTPTPSPSPSPAPVVNYSSCSAYITTANANYAPPANIYATNFATYVPPADTFFDVGGAKFIKNSDGEGALRATGSNGDPTAGNVKLRLGARTDADGNAKACIVYNDTASVGISGAQPAGSVCRCFLGAAAASTADS